MDNDQIWKAVLGELEIGISRVNFITWFKNTFIYSYSNDKSLLYYNHNLDSLNNKKRDGYKCIKFNLGPLETKSILRLG